MASVAPITSDFISKLLAPLPEGVEAVDDKSFRHGLRQDQRTMWHRRWLLLSAAEADFRAAGFAGSYARFYDQPDADAARERETSTRTAFHDATDTLMRTPAPGKDELRWKQGRRKKRGYQGDWDAAIAADESRLGVAA